MIIINCLVLFRIICIVNVAQFFLQKWLTRNLHNFLSFDEMALNFLGYKVTCKCTKKKKKKKKTRRSLPLGNGKFTDHFPEDVISLC